MVFGSGSTWPHDFLFLVCLRSGSGVPATEELVCVRDVRPASMVRSGWSSSSSSLRDSGDIISRGLTVVGEALVPKSEGYISSGVESRDSVGEPSNLMLGDAARVQECISAMV